MEHKLIALIELAQGLLRVLRLFRLCLCWNAFPIPLLEERLLGEPHVLRERFLALSCFGHLYRSHGRGGRLELHQCLA